MSLLLSLLLLDHFLQGVQQVGELWVVFLSLDPVFQQPEKALGTFIGGLINQAQADLSSSLGSREDRVELVDQRSLCTVQLQWGGAGGELEGP